MKKLRDQRFEVISLEKRFQLYLVICCYYNGESWNEEEWRQVVDLIEDFCRYKRNNCLQEGLSLLRSISGQEISRAVYDYNCLFVGPDKLLAPPYESCYRNPHKILLQQENIRVRNFYQQAGLASAKIGREPEDHLGLEFEFVCYLLSKWANSLAIDDLAYYKYEELYWSFFQEHLQCWVIDHCDDVLKSSKTDLCKGMALVLKGLMELETGELNSLNGGDKLGQTI